MEKEFIPGQTAANTKDISTMTRKKVMAYSSTQTEKSTKETGYKATSTEKES